MKDIDTRINQVQARLNDLRAIARKQVRRDETRRKVLYGAALLQLLDEISDEKAQKLKSLLHERIRRTSDRAFLNLPVGAKVPVERN